LFRRGREGASAVEFALVLPILMLFVFGIIEFGLAYNRVQAFQAAAREAGRLASVGVDVLSPTTTGSPNERVRRIAGSTVNPADVRVTVTSPCTSVGLTEVRFVRAQVSLTPAAVAGGRYVIRLPLVGSILSVSPDYSAVAEFRCERRP
jgi:Flp pilus assembly protein TadG